MSWIPIVVALLVLSACSGGDDETVSSLPPPPTTVVAETSQPPARTYDASVRRTFEVAGVDVRSGAASEQLPTTASLVRFELYLIATSLDEGALCMVGDTVSGGGSCLGLEVVGLAETSTEEWTVTSDPFAGTLDVTVAWPPIGSALTAVAHRRGSGFHSARPEVPLTNSGVGADLDFVVEQVRAAGAELGFPWLGTDIDRATSRVVVYLPVADVSSVEVVAAAVGDPRVLTIVGLAEILE